MPAQLQSFLAPGGPTLRVFCPMSAIVVTTFEDYLPDASTIAKIDPDQRPDRPSKLSWHLIGYDYRAYLPKVRTFDGHLLAPIRYCSPKYHERNGRWYLDDQNIELWQSIDIKLANSIKAIGDKLFLELGHCTPSRAATCGFARGHKSLAALITSLEISKHALVHRLAYLAYVISIRYRWDEDLGDQVWWNELTAKCGPTWVDSVWDAICRQRDSRNFIGVAVRPGQFSVRWLRSALQFGVPIWVSFPTPVCYDSLDGASVMNQWKPTQEQVAKSRSAEAAKLPVLRAKSTTPATPLLQPTADSIPESQTSPPPPPPNSLSPPNVLPDNARWYESWQEFFNKRDESNKKRLEGASDIDKQTWKSRADNAKKFSPPGKGGPKVFVWESCDSGGFFRILQTRHNILEDWEDYYKQALVFSPQDNTWDHCPFLWKAAVEDGSPDDDDDDEGRVMERWYTEPDPPATLPDDNPSPLEFLYYRYGFLSTEPTTPPTTVLPFDNSTANRIVGLEARGGERVEYLNSFISSILATQLPAGHCDLSSDAPSNEVFSPSSKTSIQGTVFWSRFPELLDNMTFTLVSAHNDFRLLVVHESLSVLQMVRAGTQPQLSAQLRHLLHNGSRFTLLYPHARPLDLPRFNILTFPLRGIHWKASTEDYRAYMSRLKTFFLERPYIVAAAFSRGGIAWRIAREVLGIEGSVDAVLNAHPDQGSSLNTSRGSFLFHELDEGEWFYLVGGYELSTGWYLFLNNIHCADYQAGKGEQRQDISWWPKVTTWEGSGIDVGCWTPMSECWFQKRVQDIQSGKVGAYSSKAWSKNLRYAKETKKFFVNCKNVGRNFLINECMIRQI